MTIATEKLKAASKRYQYVRLDHRWDVSDILISYITVYGADNLDHIKYLVKAERNGTELTRVLGTPSNNDEYSFSDGSFRVKLASAPNTDTNAIVLFFETYYTGEKYRYAPRKPDEPFTGAGGTNPMVEWEPRLSKYVDFGQTIRNIQAGILTVTSTRFDLINEDRELNRYFEPEYSYLNREVSVWQCVTDNDSMLKAYRGVTKDISIRADEVSVNTFEPFSQLEQTAYHGDAEIYAFEQSSTAYPAHFNQPVRFCYNESPVGYTTANISYISQFGHPVYGLGDGLVALCSNYSSNPSTSNNRNYTLCRVGSGGLKTQNFGTTVRQLVGVETKAYFLTGHNLQVGDTVRFGSEFGTEYCKVLYAGDTFSYLSNDYNVVLSYSLTALPPPNDLSTCTAQKQLYMLIDYRTDSGESLIEHMYLGYDYTLTEGTLPSGNKLVTITLANNFETRIGGISVFSPDNGELKFKVIAADSDTHADAIKALCEYAGLTTNAASFTAAGTALSAKVALTVPQHDRADYPTYRDVVESILYSAMGYLKINSDFETEYKLLAAPSTSAALTKADYLENSLSVRYDFNDIATSITFKNLMHEEYEGKSAAAYGVPGRDSKETATAVAKVGSQKDLIFEHVLRDITGRSQAIYDIKASRRGVYSLKTATVNIDSEIGDDITVESEELPGSPIDMKITGLKKDSKTVTITAEDLEGL